jgi:hypothetical protein
MHQKWPEIGGSFTTGSRHDLLRAPSATARRCCCMFGVLILTIAALIALAAIVLTQPWPF